MIQILCKRLSTHRDKAKRGSERKLHKHQCQPLHYDNASLRASADHARTLDRLANKWLRSANDVSQEMEVSAEVRKLEVELLYGAEVYSIFGILPDSANKRKKDRTVNEGTMQIKFACGNSRKELWGVVARRLKLRTTAPAAPLQVTQELEKKSRERVQDP